MSLRGALRRSNPPGEIAAPSARNDGEGGARDDISFVIARHFSAEAISEDGGGVINHLDEYTFLTAFHI